MTHATTTSAGMATLLILAACGQGTSNNAAPLEQEPAVNTVAAVQQDNVSTTAATPAALPKEIDAWAQKWAVTCRKLLGGSYHGYDKKFRTADFNGDGRADYILSEANIDCRGDGLDSAEAKWGRAGPENDFLVSNATGYQLVQGLTSYDEGMTIRKDPKGDRLVVGLSIPDMDCQAVASVVWAWTGKKMDSVQRLDDKGRPVRCGGDVPAGKGALPVPFGKYAVNATCAEAAMGNDYLTLSPKYWGEIDGDTPIGPFRDLGGGRWSLGSGITISVTGTRTFSEGGRTMSWCGA